MGFHFTDRKIVGEKFDGSDLRLYPQFCIGWDLADMSSSGYAGAIKLLEFKKCLYGPSGCYHSKMASKKMPSKCSTSCSKTH